MLHRLTKSSLGPKFIGFSVELEHLIDQIAIDFHQKKYDQVKLVDQIKRRDGIMAEVKKSRQKIYNFKQEVPNVKKKMEEYDLAISKHEEAIRELQSEKESLLEKDDKLKKEVNLTIKKIEESNWQDVEVAKLAEEGKLLDTKLTHSNKSLDKLRTEFKI